MNWLIDEFVIELAEKLDSNLLASASSSNYTLTFAKTNQINFDNSDDNSQNKGTAEMD